MSNKEKKINVEDNEPVSEKNNNVEQNDGTHGTQSENAKEATANNDAKDVDNVQGNDATNDDADEGKQLKEQIEDLKDRYLRQVAEFDNYKKRTLKEKADLILNGGEKTISAILPVIDDFERAIANKNDDPKAIKEGMELIYKKFMSSLESLGVKKIETDGKDFNTDFMEAIAMVPGQPDDKKGKVIDCVQSGYTLNDKVIRHAKVAVGQ